MCTVTFIPLGGTEFVLTSNRDVSYKREKASPPSFHIQDGVKLLYPRDGKAGGTWIGSSREDRLICLLNGGFENHVRQKAYRKSRGLIVTDLLASEHLTDRLQQIDLANIEPFTLVISEWIQSLELREFVWDGSEKHLHTLPLKPRIWSSSTLFDPPMQQQREAWFSSWITEQGLSSVEEGLVPEKETAPERMLEFHKNAGAGDAEVGVILKRKEVGTVSITQFVNRGGISVHYESI